MPASPDHFAQIASRHVAAKAALITPPAPPPPRRVVALGGAVGGARLRLPAKLSDAAGLARELARERRRVAPFLADLAPPLPSRRRVLDIRRWQWRIETPEDRRDFLRALVGRGEWTEVTLPHYGGPVGRHATLYRHEFDLAELGDLAERSVWACLDGADYRAQVFLNGSPLGSHEGFFAAFAFDAGAALRPGKNILLVRLENDFVHQGNAVNGRQVEGEKIYAATGPGWDEPGIGWHHCPPGMGLFDSVRLEARPRVFIHDFWVRPLDLEGRAELWLEIASTRAEPAPVTPVLEVFGQNFRGRAFAPREFGGRQPAGPGVNQYVFAFELRRPRRWDLATPWLYQAQVRLRDADGRELDTARRQFGVRTFTQDIDTEPRGRFFLNGRPVRLRGTNTMGHEQRCVMEGDLDGLRDDLLIYRAARMNFVRITQRPVQRAVYEMSDRLGLLIQTDLPLFAFLRRTQFAEAARQAGEMERHIRAHPSCVLVSYINEPFPAAWGDKSHRHLARAELEAFFRVADEHVRLHNPDRVIKAVDGDYDAPGPGLPDNHLYPAWYVGHGLCLGRLHRGEWLQVKPGWLHACGEFGAEGLDPVDLMRRRYPASWLPTNAAEEAEWTPGRITQAQSGEFQPAWFDRPATLEGWVRESQAHQAWATRFCAEAMRRDRRLVSFAIHLGIDAFPAGWMKTLVDCERRPKPAYFAYRDALAPVAAQLRSDRRAWWAGERVELEAWVCNDTAEALPGLRLQAEVLDGERVLHAGSFAADAAADDSAAVAMLRFSAPAVTTRGVLRCRLALRSAAGRLLDWTEQPIEIFPRPAKLARVVHVPPGAAADGLARQIASALGARVSTESPPPGATLLIDDFSAYERRRARIDAAIKAGARAVFFDLPPGELRLGEAGLRVETIGMNPLYFVSRATGHPLARDFAPRDFWLWHHAGAGRIAPLISRTATGDGWTEILRSGNGGWGRRWSPASAAGERALGRGGVRYCLVDLAERMETNPPALLLARALVAG